MTTVRPTKKQRQLLDFISGFIDEHGYSPSYREIMNGCGYSSIATVAVHINNLISRGHLRKRDHSARSLEVVTMSEAEAEGVVPVGAAGKGAEEQHEQWLLARIYGTLGLRDEDVDGDAAIDEDMQQAAEQCLEVLQLLALDEAAARLAARLGEQSDG